MILDICWIVDELHWKHVKDPELLFAPTFNYDIIFPTMTKIEAGSNVPWSWTFTPDIDTATEKKSIFPSMIHKESNNIQHFFFSRLTIDASHGGSDGLRRGSDPRTVKRFSTNTTVVDRGEFDFSMYNHSMPHKRDIEISSNICACIYLYIRM